MTVLLALCSAAAYGASDFVGGVLTRRTGVWAVAATSQGTAAVLTLGLVATRVGDATAAAVLWGVLAGVGSGAGNVFIYRGLAAGRMAVVAPLSAIAAAALPVLVGIAGGERPGVLPILGALTALPAIWLVSTGEAGLRGAARTDVLNGVLAGSGFGVQFSALGQIPEQAGLVPLASEPGHVRRRHRRRRRGALRAVAAAGPVRPARRRGGAARRHRDHLLPARRAERAAHHRGGPDLALSCRHRAARRDLPPGADRADAGVGLVLAATAVLLIASG